MRVVVDTNVFVSGIFFKGPPGLILNAWYAGNIQPVLSQEILDEYRRVGTMLSQRYSCDNIDPIIEILTEKSCIESVPGLSAPVCDDPDDDKFIACALAYNTKLIISGDKHLLNVHGYKSIEILRPRVFVDTYL